MSLIRRLASDSAGQSGRDWRALVNQNVTRSGN